MLYIYSCKCLRIHECVYMYTRVYSHTHTRKGFTWTRSLHGQIPVMGHSQTQHLKLNKIKEL